MASKSKWIVYLIDVIVNTNFQVQLVQLKYHFVAEFVCLCVISHWIVNKLGYFFFFATTKTHIHRFTFWVSDIALNQPSVHAIWWLQSTERVCERARIIKKKYIIKRMQFHIKPYVMNDCHIIHSVLFSTYYLCKCFLLWHFCYGTSIFLHSMFFFLFRFHVTKIVSISKNFQYTYAQQHTRCQ